MAHPPPMASPPLAGLSGAADQRKVLASHSQAMNTGHIFLTLFTLTSSLSATAAAPSQ